MIIIVRFILGKSIEMIYVIINKGWLSRLRCIRIKIDDVNRSSEVGGFKRCGN